jgi:endoglucanase
LNWLFLALALLPLKLNASRLADWALVHERLLVLHAIDGQAVVSPRGKPVNAHVEQAPLNLKLAMDAANWRVSSADDPSYAKGRTPSSVGRKSKGRDYTVTLLPEWHIENTMEHWIYLELPSSLAEGKSYAVALPAVFEGRKSLEFRYSTRRLRSEALHLNQLGWPPEALKRCYLSQWAGSLGPVDFKAWEGKPFSVLEQKTGAEALRGKITLRKNLDQPDSGQAEEGNHLRTNLWECDLSALKKSGTYVVSAPGVGISYPFEIASDINKRAFKTAMRGLYHQRCGTVLIKPWGAYERAACHVPSAAKHIHQSRIRRMDRQCDACKDVEDTGELRDIAGGWHDAGDWDREDWHFQVPMILSLAYELNPSAQRDGDLLIPESSNGLPDILDEARWGLNYWRRLQRPEGGVSVGLFLDSFPDPGEAPEDCNGHWYLYAEDPQASYRYAAAACHYIFALEKAGRSQERALWLDSARRAWNWAEKNQRPGDLGKVRDDRHHAAACLYRATSEPAFHSLFKQGLLIADSKSRLTLWGKYDQAWAAWTYVMAASGQDPALKSRLLQAILFSSQDEKLEPAKKRGLRFAVDWFRPMAWGGGIQPEALPMALAAALESQPGARDAIQANVDILLGGNPLNISFVSGLGSRNSPGTFHPDSWMHLGPGGIAPGIPVMGPVRYEAGKGSNGPWDPKFVHQSFSPDAKDWPPLELYSDARICYPMNEFTVVQIAQIAAALSALSPASSQVKP